MNVAFISLGCAKNLVNTEQMMGLCRKEGFTVTGNPEGADVAVVNTCGFIDSAKSEAIDTILSIAPLKEEGKLKKLLVAGCLTQRYREEIMTELPEIDGILGTGSYTDIVQSIYDVINGQTPNYFGDINDTDEEGERMISTPGHTAYLKIAEGCDNKCSYCVIPSLRGKYRSRPMENLLKEAEGLAKSGVQELIIIAQDITRYGTDVDGVRRLPELLKELCKLPFHWIRLHYLYPDEVDEALIEVIASEHKIVKYIDIPIQHCNDRILTAMNRRGTKAQLVALFHKMRERIPNLVLRTSIIVGLPGETEAEFEELCDFLRDMEIERAGVFPYSMEEGSVAATLPDQVDTDVAEHRAELLVDLQSRVMDSYNENRLGSVMEVLCEGFDSEEGCYVGRTYADSPDIDGRVLFPAVDLVAGTFVNVRITGTHQGDLTGEIEE